MCLQLLCVLVGNLHLDVVEALAKDAYDGTLTHEGVGVDNLDEAEYGGALVLARQDAQHLHVLASVPAVSVKNGYAVVELGAYGVSYLFVLAREDHKLHRLATSVHHIVEHKVFNHHGAETCYHDT